MLEDLANEYLEIKKEIDELTIKKDTIAEQLKKALANEPNSKYVTADGVKLSIVSSTTFKYLDETAIINYLNKVGISDMYLTKKVDTTKLNKELRLEGSLFEHVSPFINKIVTESLKVVE